MHEVAAPWPGTPAGPVPSVDVTSGIRARDGRRGTDPGRRVSRRFTALYALALMGTSLVLIAPITVTLALKVNSLVSARQAPESLALVVGVGALMAMVGTPFFGRLSDRTTSRWGMRRPWMLIGLAGGTSGVLVVAVAPNLGVVLLGWCVAQLFFNALLAAELAVLPDQVPVTQRGVVSGVLGICLPIAAIGATFVVKLVSGNQLAMFLVPCAVGGFFVVLFAATLDDRRLAAGDRPRWSVRELASTFYVDPRANRDFAWAFGSRFMLVLAYAFLTTYQVYYLLEHLGSAEDDVPDQVFLATLTQSSVVVAASLLSGRISDRVGRRKVFVLAAAVVYSLAMFLVAAASDINGFLLAVALSGVGFGMYFAVDLALVADVLPDPASAAKDLGVFNFAGALPFTVAPALAPAVLALGDGSYALLFTVAGACAALGAVAILPVRGVR
jgi:MFS family permease